MSLLTALLAPGGAMEVRVGAASAAGAAATAAPAAADHKKLRRLAGAAIL
jgi:hypothetical protein